MKNTTLIWIALMLFVGLTGCSPLQPAPAPPTGGGATEPLPTLPGAGGEGESGEPTAEPGEEIVPTANLFAELNFRDGWARIPFNVNIFGGSGADQMNDVVAGSPGIVAVGFTIRSGNIDGAVWYSMDAVTWFKVTDDAELGGPGSQSINALALGDNGFVAVGTEQIGEDDNAAVWFSPDGLDWRRVRSGSAVFGDANSQVMEHVAAWDEGFVAVGIEKTDTEVRGAVWTSPDGLTWQRSPHSEAAFGGATRFTDLTAVLPVGSSLLAAGTVQPVDVLDVDAAVWFSHDGGETWTQVETPESSLGDPGAVRFQLVAGIAQGGPGFIMVATEQNLAGSPSGEYVNGLVWSSPDGVDWTRVFDHKPDFNQQTMQDVAFTQFGFFAGGYDTQGEETQAAVWSSTDGGTWSQTPHSEIVFGGPGLQRINALAEAGPGVVAVGSTTENGEQDAAVWIYVPER